ncbi:MAG: hypothetical protein E7001_07640 [Coriobacteriaceae bacterium]|nr:hypothetical protein [Coriobacteriaceae bacterium]
MVARVAAIDIGTVSSRLALAVVRDGAVTSHKKRTVITDLGEGVDATSRLSDAAIERVLAACREFAAEASAFAPDGTCTTLTSAARDAENGGVLLAGLADLGLCPIVIPGEVEARLTFFGVAHDFPGQRIAVADSGGGSTEIACGRLDPAPETGEPGCLRLDAVESLDIGCRRVTDRFLLPSPPDAQRLDRASSFAAEAFGRYWGRVGCAHPAPDRLIAVGGTVTTLVAMRERMAVYDSARVHLASLTQGDVEAMIALMEGCTADQIAELPGVQPKRAPVILAGAVVIRELLRAGGYEELTVSENGLLTGMAVTMTETLERGATSIGWVPELS